MRAVSSVFLQVLLLPKICLCFNFQRFLGGVGESVACEAEVLEHSFYDMLDFASSIQSTRVQQMSQIR